MKKRERMVNVREIVVFFDDFSSAHKRYDAEARLREPANERDFPFNDDRFSRRIENLKGKVEVSLKRIEEEMGLGNWKSQLKVGRNILGKS